MPWHWSRGHRDWSRRRPRDLYVRYDGSPAWVGGFGGLSRAAHTARHRARLARPGTVKLCARG
eukprot:5449579-Ditylum_brightwellii.AAC.1